MPVPYWSDDTVTLLLGDARETLAAMPDGSVDCIVTSPPYFGLRDYGTAGQYGLELTPAAYVETMRGVFAEARRVLADDGTLWLNLGDSYAYPPGSGGRQGGSGQRADRAFTAEGRPGTREVPPKNLLMIPARVALSLQDDGWILRSEIIWAKRNLMPEAVKDRPTRSHEQVFLLSKRPKYFYDADAIREESASAAQEAHNQRYARQYEAHTARAATTGQPGNVNSVGVHSGPGRVDGMPATCGRSVRPRILRRTSRRSPWSSRCGASRPGAGRAARSWTRSPAPGRRVLLRGSLAGGTSASTSTRPTTTSRPSASARASSTSVPPDPPPPAHPNPRRSPTAMTAPLPDDQLAKIRADVQLSAEGPMVGVPRGAERYAAWLRVGDQHGAALLAEVDRLRAVLAAVSAKVDQFPLFADESKASDYDLGRHDLAETVRNIISPPRKPASA